MPRNNTEIVELEEVKLAGLFRSCGQYFEAVQIRKHNYTSVSSVIRSCVAVLGLRGSAPCEVLDGNLYTELCKTREIKSLLTESGLVNFIPDFDGNRRNAALEMYFELLALHAEDVILTYRYDPQTGYGQIWHNSGKGPDIWS